MSELHIKQHAVLCPSGHSMNDVSLKGMHGDSFTFECNMCRKAICHQHLPYMCEPCAYYLCAYCFNAIQSIQWTQQNDIKSRLIYKGKPIAQKKKSNKHLVKPFAVDGISPITVLNKIKLLDSKYWHTSVTFLIKIIEDAMFNKSSHATSIKEELQEKKTKRSINYHKLYHKLYEYSNHHRFCRNELLNMLFHFGFRANAYGPALSEKTRLSWNKAEDQSRHPQMCALYCEMKNMIQQNYKITNIDDNDASSFYNELIECPMRFIIDRYTMNENICTNVSNLIYQYTFNEYKVMKVRDCSSCSFMIYLQLLQDPKQFNSVVIFIGHTAYVYTNITPFERPTLFGGRRRRRKRKKRTKKSGINVPSIRWTGVM
eukprot:51497_1